MKRNYFLQFMMMALLMFALGSTMQAQLYINEFMASNDGSVPGPQGDGPDWIEIYNAGTEAVMLGGYYMSDVLDDPAAMYQIPSTYPDSVTVEAGGFILFYANKDEDYSVLNLNFKLSGSGESIGLWNPEQVVVDELTYGEQTTDVSYGRYADGTDNWFFMTNFTPGAANESPAPAEVILYINEFMASNDGSVPGPQGDNPDWIEIYNAGMEPVMLGGYYMSDVLDDPAAMYQIPSTYPDSVTVEAGGYILFYANKGEATSVLNLNFKLSGSGESIGLWNPDQEVVDELTYGEQTTDVSYGRFPDGADDWFFMTNFTPGAANQSPAPAEAILFINEFMASNDFAFPGPQGDYPDWIEIYNAGMEPVMLGGYYLSDKLDEPDAMYQIPSTYPDSVTVQPGEFILFYANDDTAWSVLNTNFKLSGGGEHVGLWSPEKAVLDTITYGEQIADTSYGRYQDGTENWFMMADYTPGMSNTNPNIGPSDVMLYINEFMASNDFAFAGPQGDFPDWIEIYNAGDEAVMLGGYYLSDKLDVPEDMYQIPSTYPDSVTVDAGDFILFYCNDDTAWSVLNTNFKLSGGGEQVGLWSPEMVVLDSLTYGDQIADTSYGRYLDGTENWYMMPDFTPGAPNMYTDAIIETVSNIASTQNFPNPFTNETTIEFTLNEADVVQITLYSMTGSVLAKIADGQFNSGTHSVKWSGSNLPAGYYFYSIKTSTNVVTKKVTKLR